MMRVKNSALEKYIIIFMMMNSLMLFRVFGGIFARNRVCMVVSLLLILVCVALENKRLKTNKFVNIQCLLICIPVLLFSPFISDATADYQLECTLMYLHILLAIPLYSLLVSGKWSLNKLLKTILLLTMIALTLKAFICLTEYFTGNRILVDVYQETSGRDWYRNGFMRIIPPCFFNIIIPVILFLFYESSKKKERRSYIFCIAIVFLYTDIVYGSRAMLVYQIIELIFCIFIHRRSSSKKLILLLLFSAVAIITINSGIIDNFIEGFSITSGQYGRNTLSRLISYEHFWNIFRDNWLMGTGFLAGSDQYFIASVSSWGLGEQSGHLSDIGILYSLVQLGISLLVFYFLLFYKGIKVGKSLYHSKNNFSVLLLGIVLSIALCEVSIDLFYEMLYFTAPFCIAIVGYMSFIQKQGRKVKS